MKSKRRTASAVLLLLLPVLVFQVIAHPGRTDSNGGHNDTSSGDYHYHHGYPEHDHYDIDGDGIDDCPYDFMDGSEETNSNTVGSSSDTTHRGQNITSESNDSSQINVPDNSSSDSSFSLADYFAISFLLPLLALPLIILSSAISSRGYKRLSYVVLIVSMLPSFAFPVSLFIAFPILHICDKLRKKRPVQPPANPVDPPSPPFQRIAPIARSSPTNVPALQPSPPVLQPPVSEPPLTPQREVNPSTLHTPAYYICHYTWRFVDLYISEVGGNIDRKQHMYLWSACFYAVTKAIGNQQFIDEIYSHFETFAIRRVADPVHRSFVVDDMRADYREIRPLLNASKINPCTVGGIQQLWDFTSAMVYPGKEPPAGAEKFFISCIKSVVKKSLRQYESVYTGDQQRRYSISAEPDTSLPDSS